MSEADGQGAWRVVGWLSLAWVLAAIGLVLTAIGVSFVLNHENRNGYCAATKSYITEENMIDAGIAEVLRLQDSRCPSSDASLPCRSLVKYLDRSDFKTQNPKCCSVGRGPDDPRPGIFDFLLSLEGESAGHVNVDYLHREVALDGKIAMKKASQGFKITNCGRVRAPW